MVVRLLLVDLISRNKSHVRRATILGGSIGLATLLLLGGQFQAGWCHDINPDNSYDGLQLAITPDKPVYEAAIYRKKTPTAAKTTSVTVAEASPVFEVSPISDSPVPALSPLPDLVKEGRRTFQASKATASTFKIKASGQKSWQVERTSNPALQPNSASSPIPRYQPHYQPNTDAEDLDAIGAGGETTPAPIPRKPSHVFTNEDIANYARMGQSRYDTNSGFSGLQPLSVNNFPVSQQQHLQGFIRSVNKNLPSELVSYYTWLILNESSQKGLDYRLVASVIAVESSFRADALSSSGAIGLGQLKPATASWLGVNNPWDPSDNLQGVTKYLSFLVNRYGGDLDKAISAYYQGQGTVDRNGITPACQPYLAKINNVLRLF